MGTLRTSGRDQPLPFRCPAVPPPPEDVPWVGRQSFGRDQPFLFRCPVVPSRPESVPGGHAAGPAAIWAGSSRDMSMYFRVLQA